MGVKITGLKRLEKELDDRLGPKRMREVTDKALKAGAQVFVKQLKIEFEKFKDTGNSIKEITLSEPQWVNGQRAITVYWKGPNDRYRIIHLNEHGTVKNPNPAGKGAIARAMSRSQDAYREAVKKEMRRLASG